MSIRTKRKTSGQSWDPERNPLDYLSARTTRQALKKGLKPPFSLHFYGGDGSLFATAQVWTDGRKVKLKINPEQRWVEATLPLRCVAGNGEAEVSLSVDEMNAREKDGHFWLDSPIINGDNIELTFTPDRPNFSPELYRCFVELFISLGSQDIYPPYSAEVRDAHGKLFGPSKILVSPGGYLCFAGENLFYGADLTFPVTVQIIREGGQTFTRNVERKGHVDLDGCA